LIALFISCSDSPTSVGENLIPDQDKINFAQYDSFTEDTPQKSFTYKEKLKLGIAEKVLLGKSSVGEASLMYKYWIYMDDSLLTRIKNNELIVTSAKMEMKTAYKFGDANAYFDFSVHQIRSPWTQDGFEEDSLKSLQYDASDVSLKRTITDSVITVDLKPSVVTEWLKYKKDTTLTRNYGLIFKPKTGTNRIVGFDAVVTDGSSDNILMTFIVERAAVNYKDTIYVSPFWDVHTLVGTKPVSDNHMFLQGSMGLRSVLSFDISKLPRNIILNKAILELSVDPAQTLDGTPASDSIIVQTLKDSVTKKLTSDSLYYVYLKRTGNVYSGDIAWMIQKWIKGDANQGIQLALPDEYFSASRIAIYNSNETNKALRPRLKLIYTIK
jgi:hypothetical protein